MGGIKIIGVKVVGVCSKHRKKEDKIPAYKDGRIIEDKDLACVSCDCFKDKGSASSSEKEQGK